MILWLIFIASMIVFATGKTLDYRNSLGRGEQNKDFQDARGYFDPQKYKRVAVLTGVIIAGVGLASTGMLSFGTPHYAYGLLLAAGPALVMGVYGIVLSRR